MTPTHTATSTPTETAAPTPQVVTERVSVDSAGNQASGDSGCHWDPGFGWTCGVPTTTDGRLVAFPSWAPDLVEDDTNGVGDMFVHDRWTGVTERISVDSSGNQANSHSLYGTTNTDGRYVAFVSMASDLVPGDTNNAWDVFVHDRATGVTERVNVDSSGGQANEYSGIPSISTDGRYVAFESRADNLVPGDTNSFCDADGDTVLENCTDVFVRDRQTGTTTRISVDSAGNQANWDVVWPAISTDGRFVAFSSAASNLVPFDTNGVNDVFVHDRQTGITERISLDTSENQGSGHSGCIWWDYGGTWLCFLSISADGRYVAFNSEASNLVPGDTNGFIDVFVRDRQTGTTKMVSVDSAGSQSNQLSAVEWGSLSVDGRYVAFASFASNLVSGDTNAQDDMFVHDSTTGSTARVSLSSSGEQGNERSWFGSISNDGQYVAFASLASNLVDDDTNGAWDVFVSTNPSPDTDGDGLPNTYEEAHVCLDVGVPDADADPDTDGLSNTQERDVVTDPCSADTDGDTLSDGDEVNTHGTDPRRLDTDGDGLADGDELSTHGTLPTEADSEGDGIWDGYEVEHTCLDPHANDAVGDPDTDGLTSAEEFTLGTDACLGDSDGDGLTDGDEVNTHLTDPLSADTDDDALSDSDEISVHGTLPTDPDSDDDGLSDGYEVSIGTSPSSGDSDTDTFADRTELNLGSDPMDISSTPEHASVEGTCTDTLDNDLDSLVDANDPDCVGVPPPEIEVEGPGTLPDGTPAGIRGVTETIRYTSAVPAYRAEIDILNVPSHPLEIHDLMVDVLGDGTVWEYTFVPPYDWPPGSTMEVTICLDLTGDLIPDLCVDPFGIVLIDPSGKVYDTSTGEAIVGAEVTLYQIHPFTGEAIEMSPTLHAGMFEPEVNPQTTGADGRYAWDVVAGDYFVTVEVPGCEPATSETVTAPPPVTDLDIGLACPDTDGDHLKDYEEVTVHETDAGVVDTDRGGAPDGLEVLQGTDPLNPDDDGDAVTTDPDGDGCVSSEELAGAPAPKPGATGAYDPLDPYDVYDVPVPAVADPDPNGTRNALVDIGDVLGVLLYVFADEGGPPNANGVSYDTVKGSCDVDGDTAPEREGLCYDRSPSEEPNPPWDAGPPNGAIDMGDVLAALAQAFVVDCSGPP